MLRIEIDEMCCMQCSVLMSVVEKRYFKKDCPTRCLVSGQRHINNFSAVLTHARLRKETEKGGNARPLAVDKNSTPAPATPSTIFLGIHPSLQERKCRLEDPLIVYLHLILFSWEAHK